MSWWLWVLVVGAGWFVLGCVVAACWTVGRQSHEGRGVIRFDTPRARSALRRCSPDRRVHYFDIDWPRCECGQRTCLEHYDRLSRDPDVMLALEAARSVARDVDGDDAA